MQPTDEMLEAGCEVLYGHTRPEAIEWAKEDKFDSYREMARDVWLAMLKASPFHMKEGKPPIGVAGPFTVLLENGQTRTVDLNQNLDPISLWFTDCDHPLQNALCDRGSIVSWTR